MVDIQFATAEIIGEEKQKEEARRNHRAKIKCPQCGYKKARAPMSSSGYATVC